MAAQNRSHALVVGASLAGLATARVLADHFGAVTVLDRDELPDTATARKGVPQGRHAHGLLAAGGEVVAQLFPGIVDELIAAGASDLDGIRDVRWYQFGGYRTRQSDTSVPTPFFSRPLFEGVLRARVRALPNVTIRPGVRVEGLFGGPNVDGVAIVGGETIAADFVVDCSGRRSQVEKWMADLACETPKVSHVKIDMGYASRFLHRSASDPIRNEWVITITSPPEPMRGAAMFPVDGDRWIVTLFGFHNTAPSTDEAEFLRFAESLPTDDVASVLRAAAPATEIVTHKLPSDQRRHFEKLRRLPGGFVTLGDSIASFNPIYGQGMSSALLQARALGEALARFDGRSPKLARDFYRRAKKVVDMPWQIAAGGEWMMPQTTGVKAPGTDFVNKYLAKAFVAAQHDPVVNDAVVRVQNLLAPPPSLMKPNLMLRVLKGAKHGPADNVSPRQAAAVTVDSAAASTP